VATSRITHLREATHVRIEAGSAPMVLAVDGETMPGVRVAEFALKRGALTYYSPLDEG
jgi:undecaprenyl-diphosphatase